MASPADCKHSHTSFIHGEQGSGPGNDFHNTVFICLDCGEIQVNIFKNGVHERVTFELLRREQIEAATLFHNLIQESEGRPTLEVREVSTAKTNLGERSEPPTALLDAAATEKTASEVLKKFQGLILRVNAVTSYHRHGNAIPKWKLDELSNYQLECEEIERAVTK